MSDSPPRPDVTDVDRGFWDAAANHQFCVQECLECHELRWPPSTLCHDCWSEAAQWVELSGEGTVNSWVVFHHSYFDAFEDEVPFTVAEVELAEGPQYIGRLVDCEQDELYRGMQVEVLFEDIDETMSLPIFAPA